MNACTSPTIQDIFCDYGDEYLERFGPRMPGNHRKVLEAIRNCRRGKYGYTVYQCQKCRKCHFFQRSCGNRHCTVCQKHKSKQWLARQKARALPVSYFLITFTVPESLREFIRSNQRACYNALFKASSGALKKLALDPRFVGTDMPGFTGVLQTWGRQLQYHPHIHYIVPGGGLSKDRKQWLSSRKNFYLPVKALSPIYTEMFRQAMAEAGLLEHIHPKAWKTNWNVDSRAVGTADTSLKYLAPYIFKVGISDHRIVKVEDRKVTFSYRDKETKVDRICVVDVMEFIRRFLQHVLPDGFMKVRHFGFMSPGCKTSLDKIAELIIGLSEETDRKQRRPLKRDDSEMLDDDTIHCPDCGGVLVYIAAEIPTLTGSIILLA
ncbi:MAG: transposase [Planctomycetota bacterium]|nr:transposase [Planctomycetota bacterium]MDA1143222.1 transposase [Planctomycetota bacterium]